MTLQVRWIKVYELVLSNVQEIQVLLCILGINDSKEFANKCSMELWKKDILSRSIEDVREETFFCYKVSMKVAEKKKQVIILRLKLELTTVKFSLTVLKIECKFGERLKPLLRDRR